MTAVVPLESLSKGAGVEDARTDAELVAAVLAGDRRAFTGLVRRHQEFLHRYATSMLGDPHDAADVLQESFLRAFRGLERCREPSEFRAWLFVIVANQCRTAGATRRRRDTVPLESVPEPEGESSDAAHGVREQAEVLAAALQRLDEDQREILTLKYLQERSVDEIARLLELSRSAVKMRLLRAREALRLTLADDGWEA